MKNRDKITVAAVLFWVIHIVVGSAPTEITDNSVKSEVATRMYIKELDDAHKVLTKLTQKPLLYVLSITKGNFDKDPSIHIKLTSLPSKSSLFNAEWKKLLETLCLSFSISEPAPKDSSTNKKETPNGSQPTNPKHAIKVLISIEHNKVERTSLSLNRTKQSIIYRDCICEAVNVTEIFKVLKNTLFSGYAHHLETLRAKKGFSAIQTLHTMGCRSTNSPLFLKENEFYASTVTINIPFELSYFCEIKAIIPTFLDDVKRSEFVLEIQSKKRLVCGVNNKNTIYEVVGIEQAESTLYEEGYIIKTSSIGKEAPSSHLRLYYQGFSCRTIYNRNKKVSIFEDYEDVANAPSPMLAQETSIAVPHHMGALFLGDVIDRLIVCENVGQLEISPIKITFFANPWCAQREKPKTKVLKLPSTVGGTSSFVFREITVKMNYFHDHLVIACNQSTAPRAPKIAASAERAKEAACR